MRSSKKRQQDFTSGELMHNINLLLKNYLFRRKKSGFNFKYFFLDTVKLVPQNQCKARRRELNSCKS